MAYATRRRRRRSARSKRLWQSFLRRLRGPQLSVDDLRTFEDTEVDGRDRTDSATQLQAQWDAGKGGFGAIYSMLGKPLPEAPAEEAAAAPAEEPLPLAASERW